MPTSIEEATYDSSKEWSADPKGYFIIKVYYKKNKIGVRYCNYKHQPIIDIFGNNAEAIVQTLVRKELISKLQHAAYLGHELHKAEVALKLKLDFNQDKPLDFKKKATADESQNRP